jgi:small-conductance mechanosensitive channel
MKPLTENILKFYVRRVVAVSIVAILLLLFFWTLDLTNMNNNWVGVLVAAVIFFTVFYFLARFTEAKIDAWQTKEMDYKEAKIYYTNDILFLLAIVGILGYYFGGILSKTGMVIAGLIMLVILYFRFRGNNKRYEDSEDYEEVKEEVEETDDGSKTVILDAEELNVKLKTVDPKKEVKKDE